MRRFLTGKCQKALDGKQRDLPKRTGPFVNYIRVIITPQRRPGRRLTGADYQHFTANLGNIWETL